MLQGDTYLSGAIAIRRALMTAAFRYPLIWDGALIPSTCVVDMVMSGGDAIAPAAFVTKEALDSKLTCVVASYQSSLVGIGT